MLDDHVERFTASNPAHELPAQQPAHLLQGLDAVRVFLSCQRDVYFSQSVFAGGGHSPGKKPAAAEIRPGVVSYRSLLHRDGHLGQPTPSCIGLSILEDGDSATLLHAKASHLGCRFIHSALRRRFAILNADFYSGVTKLPRRQRRRRQGSGDYAGPRKAKPPFPINIVFNQKFFYISFIVIMIASLAAVGLSPFGSSSKPNTPAAENRPSEATTAANPKSFPGGPAPTIDGTKPYVATLHTNKGDIKIQLVTDAPAAVNSFAFLAGNGFYDGTAFFWVDHNFVAQAGDPGCQADQIEQCSGSGDAGYTLPVEKTQESHQQWAVVAPYKDEAQNASGSQFRILFQDQPSFEGKETVFGKVIQGQDVLESLKDVRPCSVSQFAGCDVKPDTSSLLVIQKVTVQPA